jgi:HK97 family phage prohead protease
VRTKRVTVPAYTKAVDSSTREVEQIVSVFDNVDLTKDRVKPGAFTASLTRWAASGDPIPVIWSHMWDDPYAHVGFVIEAKELAAGDALLPPPIVDLGGLYTRYKVDETPFADQVFLLLKGRRVREASFAYDVIREKRNNDGTTDLLELDVIEVGPTLKGANPMTQLLAAKKVAGRRHAESPAVTCRYVDDLATRWARAELAGVTSSPLAALAEINRMEV